MEFLHLATDFSDVTGYASNNTRERSPICLLGLMCGTNAHLFSNIISTLVQHSEDICVCIRQQKNPVTCYPRRPSKKTR